MKRKNIQKVVMVAASVTAVILNGCDRQETIAYFNHIEYGTEADTEAGDGSQDRDTSSKDGLSAEDVMSESGLSAGDVTSEGGVAGDVTSSVDNSGDAGETVDNPDAAADNYTGPTVSLVMVGDILLHTPVAESGVQEDGSYNFDALFANVRDEIEAADLALVNQEVIIGGEELGVSGYPSFNAPYELGDALAAAGFDVVLHATNHALDQGKKGVKNCLSFWENHYSDMAVLGINGSQEAQNQIYVYEQDGIRIAILNYTYGTNGVSLPTDMPYAVNLLEEEQVTADIAKAKEQADFVVVCPHWGTEYQLTPSAEQEYWTEIFAENGVDLVIGTHPHVIQPVEWVSDGMLVYYSLGNFVNWTASSGEGIANRMVGGMAEVTIGKDENGEAFIVEYDVKPLVCHVTEGTNGVTTYLLSDYTEELAAENAITAQDDAFSMAYCEALCEEIWGDRKK